MKRSKTVAPDNYPSKIYARIDVASDPAIAHLRERLDEPLFIACPGPSSARIDPAQVIGQGPIFRMNAFFFEQTPQFGTVVDGYFWSFNGDALYDGMQAAVEQGRYQIKTFFTPLEPKREDNDQAKLARYKTLFKPASDHWALIATNPVLGRDLMGRPLPTQAFQVLAAAAAIGFREIHLIGVDMYSDATQRYVFPYPEDVKKRVDAKHYTPKYEAGAHGVERDFLFLDLVQSQFPHVRIFNASDVSPLRAKLPDSRLMAGQPVRSGGALPASALQGQRGPWLQRLKARLPLPVRARLAQLRQRLAHVRGEAARLLQAARR